MSKLRDALRAHRIYNNHDMLVRFGKPGRDGDLAVEYTAASRGRIGFGQLDHTAIWNPWVNTSLYRGRRNREVDDMTFYGQRKRSWPAAMSWLLEHRPGIQYEPSPFGGHLPKHVIKKAREFIANQERKDT